MLTFRVTGQLGETPKQTQFAFFDGDGRLFAEMSIPQSIGATEYRMADPEGPAHFFIAAPNYAPFVGDAEPGQHLNVILFWLGEHSGSRILNIPGEIFTLHFLARVYGGFSLTNFSEDGAILETSDLGVNGGPVGDHPRVNFRVPFVVTDQNGNSAEVVVVESTNYRTLVQYKRIKNEAQTADDVVLQPENISQEQQLDAATIDIDAFGEEVHRDFQEQPHSVVKQATNARDITSALQAMLNDLRLNSPEAQQVQDLLTRQANALDNVLGLVRSNEPEAAEKTFKNLLVDILNCYLDVLGKESVTRGIVATAALTVLGIAGAASPVASGIIAASIIGLDAQAIARFLSKMGGKD